MLIAKKLLRSLCGPLALTALVAMTATLWYVTRVIDNALEQKNIADLTVVALTATEMGRNDPDLLNSVRITPFFKEIAGSTAARITILDAGGKVVSDSHQSAERLGDLSDRPEIQAAMGGKRGFASRRSLSLDAYMTFVALPVIKNERVVGVVRAGLPLINVSTALMPYRSDFIILALLLVTASTGVGYLHYRNLVAGLNRISSGLDAFAGGDLRRRIDPPSTEELAHVATAANDMAGALSARLLEVRQQKTELEAVFTSMLEAVLVFDTQERLIQVNQAAECLFQIRAERARGRSLQEAIRNTDLHRFVRRTLASRVPSEGEITILGNPDRNLQAHGALLRNEDSELVGAVVVLNDVTRLKTLENIRRDFVANVSHELKTPITSIKGFLETLRDGAINDPRTAEQFLDIMIRQTDRLHAIIEDLLSLSRIERDAEKSEITLTETNLSDVLEGVGRACQKKAEAKEISLKFEADKDIRARINPTLLEQAVVNLVDNAVQYSPQGSSIEIVASRTDGDIAISVRDHGTGISKDHLPRIFERFYRVDKARSRKAGGTGLGLAIVKHIVNAHGGRVTVESTLGEGSTFTITLPLTGKESR